jgi:hypothetical protein
LKAPTSSRPKVPIRFHFLHEMEHFTAPLLILLGVTLGRSRRAAGGECPKMGFRRSRTARLLSGRRSRAAGRRQRYSSAPVAFTRCIGDDVTAFAQED